MPRVVDGIQPDPSVVVAAGVVGTAILASGIALTIHAYNDDPSDPFLLRNRFVSELGWMARSPLARVFNISIALGTLLFAPVLYALGSRSSTRIYIVARLFGSASIASASAVGLFPMDDLKSHFVVTLIFFCTWPVTVALFTVAFWREPTGPDSKLMVPVGIAALISCILLLICPKQALIAAIRALLHNEPFTRPKVWWPAVFEWTLVFCAGLWMAAATAILWRSQGIPLPLRDRLQRQRFA